MLEPPSAAFALPARERRLVLTNPERVYSRLVTVVVVRRHTETPTAFRTLTQWTLPREWLYTSIYTQTPRCLPGGVSDRCQVCILISDESASLLLT